MGISELSRQATEAVWEASSGSDSEEELDANEVGTDDDVPQWQLQNWRREQWGENENEATGDFNTEKDEDARWRKEMEKIAAKNKIPEKEVRSMLAAARGSTNCEGLLAL